VVYFAVRHLVHPHVLDRLALDLVATRWLFKHGMQDFAGSTVVHYQGALAALAGALILGPRIGKFERTAARTRSPGTTSRTRARHADPLVRLVRLQPRLDSLGRLRRVRFFAYVATTTNLAAAAGALTGICVAWLKLGKPDISMMLNGALGALVAITVCVGLVAPWAAIVIGIGSGTIAVFGVIFIESIGIDDPIGAVAVHGMSGVWARSQPVLFAVPVLAKNLATGTGRARLHGSFHQLGVQALGVAAVGVFTFTTSFVHSSRCTSCGASASRSNVETAGLDVSEHGMWGYPEFYIPVPGGYGTESHGHLGGGQHREHRPIAVPSTPVVEG